MNSFINKLAQDFTVPAVMPNGKINNTFNLKTFLQHKKGVLFFYPLDFTFVCPSEIISLDNKINEFKKRQTEVIGISVDSHFAHYKWTNTPRNEGGIGQIKFPLISDIKKEISIAYEVLNDDGISLRGTFLIDESFKIKHYLINDLPIGRNIDETIRTIDAINHYNNYGEVCPAGWNKGDKAIIPTDKGIAQFLSLKKNKL